MYGHERLAGINKEGKDTQIQAVGQSQGKIAGCNQWLDNLIVLNCNGIKKIHSISHWK